MFTITCQTKVLGRVHYRRLEALALGIPNYRTNLRINLPLVDLVLNVSTSFSSSHLAINYSHRSSSLVLHSHSHLQKIKLLSPRPRSSHRLPTFPQFRIIIPKMRTSPTPSRRSSLTLPPPEYTSEVSPLKYTSNDETAPRPFFTVDLSGTDYIPLVDLSSSSHNHTLLPIANPPRTHKKRLCRNYSCSNVCGFICAMICTVLILIVVALFVAGMVIGLRNGALALEADGTGTAPVVEPEKCKTRMGCCGRCD